MRGEETLAMPDMKPEQELPPHARRRDTRAGSIFAYRGITSACAEKSRPDAQPRRQAGNYLRMRGEEGNA